MSPSSPSLYFSRFFFFFVTFFFPSFLLLPFLRYVYIPPISILFIHLLCFSFFFPSLLSFLFYADHFSHIETSLRSFWVDQDRRVTTEVDFTVIECPNVVSLCQIRLSIVSSYPWAPPPLPTREDFLISKYVLLS